jgi:glycoside/pentoside/hexuronide:cation symporter, GPH family
MTMGLGEVVEAGAEITTATPAPSRLAEISSWLLSIYALPSIPIAFLYLPVAILMPPYYASVLHVSLTSIGGFLLISRAIDVVLDPMIGKWSDSTRSRLGRRKIWMFIGSPILMVGAYLLFMPPVAPSGWYLMVASFVIYAGGSTVGLPYSAWGTELAESYHGRARMAGFREAAGVIGGLLAAIVPAVTAHYGHGVDRFTMSILGWMIIVLTPLTVIIASLFVAEPPARKRVEIKWLRAVPELLRNGPFFVLCGAYVLFNFGASIASATMVFYLSDYLGASTIIGPALLTLAVTTVLAVPLWLAISRRIGKHRAIAYSLLMAMAIFGLAVPMLHRGQGYLFVWIAAVLGAVSSGYITLPIGIIGDVIDYDTLKHRVPRGGLYWGVWSFTQKVTPAFSIALTLPMLKWLGFNPGGHNTPAALEALKYTFCYSTIPLYVAGAILLLYFPLDARRHAIIRRRLEQREARARRVSDS